MIDIEIEDDMPDFLADVIQEHVNAFGVEPVVIGLFWRDPDAVRVGILNAIKTGKPYNERLMFSVEERAGLDVGEILL
jgi:hypothetical protein